MKRVLFVYMAAPAILAVYNGSRGTIWAPDLDAFKTTLLFLGCGVPLWLFMGALAHGVLPLCRVLGIRPYWALIPPWVASVPAGYFDVILFIHAFGRWFPGLDRLLVDTTTMVGGFWTYVASPKSLLMLPLWLLAQFVYERATRDILFFAGWIAPAPAAEERGGAAESAPQASTFLLKVRPEIRGRILALEAQEHYVKVHADPGEDFILYRFGDAVAEVSRRIEGLQVHRSYWVAQDAVTAVTQAGKTYRLTLRNGLEVPVSLSYRGAIQQHRIFRQGETANTPAEAPLIRAS